MKARGEDPVAAGARRARPRRPAPPPRCRLGRASTSRSSRPTAPSSRATPRCWIVPGAAGEIGVLARHAPLVATLKAGATRVHLGAERVEEFTDRAGLLHRAAGSSDRARRPRGQRRPRSTARRPSRCSRRPRPSWSGSSSGESTADRWVVEQRLIHAQTQLEVATGGRPPRGSRQVTPAASAAKRAATLFALESFEAAWRPG